jgi:hypothetical protein
MTSFDTPDPISVTIEVPLGQVHLIAGERADTIVVVNPSDRSRKADVEAAASTTVEHSGGRLLIHAPKPRGLGNYIGVGRGGSVEVTVELPEGSRVQGDLGFAAFRGDGRLGEVRIKAGVGDIQLDQTGPLHLDAGAGTVTVERATGRTEIASAGDMRIGEIEGEAEIKNLNGKTWLGHVTGGLRVKSANGDITVEVALAGVGAKTSNGSIRIGDVVHGVVVLETGSGGVDIGIRGGTAAWVDASTRFGRVHNSLEAVDGPEQSQQTVDVRARTAFGDVAIHRS